MLYSFVIACIVAGALVAFVCVVGTFVYVANWIVRGLDWVEEHLVHSSHHIK